MKFINPHLAQKHLLQNAQLIDVSTVLEFSHGYIPESINYPLDRLREDIKQNNFSIADNKLLILTCQSGNRAQLAAKDLLQFAIEVEILDGGNQAWIKNGFDIIRDNGVISLERQIRIAAGAIGLVGSLLSYFIDPDFILIPTLVGAGLVNSGVTNWCGLGQLLAKMPWNNISTVDRNPIAID